MGDSEDDVNVFENVKKFFAPKGQCNCIFFLFNLIKGKYVYRHRDNFASYHEIFSELKDNQFNIEMKIYELLCVSDIYIYIYIILRVLLNWDLSCSV